MTSVGKAHENHMPLRPWIFRDYGQPIKNKYGIKKNRLEAYSKRVWDLIDTFEAFNITLLVEKGIIEQII